MADILPQLTKVMEKSPDHPAAPTGKVALLLVNLGTPDAPETGAVKRYLREFLSDKRVVEIPDIIWQPILRGIILNTRPKKSAANYAKIWMDEGSPLDVYTARQAKGLQAALGENIRVDYAMRYGNPSLKMRLMALKDEGFDRIMIAPLYPQYSGATTASVLDECYRIFMDLRWQPAIRTLPPYYDDPHYIHALKNRLETQLAALDFVPDALITSFHGMPERTLHLGDPYHCHCRKTARLLSEAMGRDIVVSFQSRFGKAKWLEPATDMILQQLGENGVKNVAITAPGFSVDCLETLEELAIQGDEQFKQAGGENFAYLPCLNDSDIGQDMLNILVKRELAGWIG